MLSIVICLGNVCDQTNESDKITSMLERLIREGNLEDRIEMFSTPCKGSLCMDGCSQGVCLRVDEKVFRGLTPDSLDNFFESEVLPLI